MEYLTSVNVFPNEKGKKNIACRSVIIRFERLVRHFKPIFVEEIPSPQKNIEISQQTRTKKQTPMAKHQTISQFSPTFHHLTTRNLPPSTVLPDAELLLFEVRKAGVLEVVLEGTKKQLPESPFSSDFLGEFFFHPSCRKTRTRRVVQSIFFERNWWGGILIFLSSFLLIEFCVIAFLPKKNTKGKISGGQNKKHQL